MITGAFAPDAGTVRVFGLDPAVDGEEVRRRCGVVSAKPALYDRLSGSDNLRYSAELYGLGRGAPVDDRIREAAGRFGIDGALDDQVGGYSTGMKTRLALARVGAARARAAALRRADLGPRPRVVARRARAHPRDDRATARTVVMCTHLLLEAEGLADQVVVLEDGTDLIAGSPDELTRRYWPDAMVRLDADDADRARRARRTHDGRRRLRARPTTSPWSASTHADRVPDLVARARRGRRPRHPGRAPRADARGPLLRRPRRSSGRSRLGRRRRERRLMAATIAPRRTARRGTLQLGPRLDRRPHRPQAARPGPGLLDPDADPRRRSSSCSCPPSCCSRSPSSATSTP